MQPTRLQPFIEKLAALLAKYPIEAICGPLIGGAFISAMIANILDIEFYYTERFVNQGNDALYPVEYKIPSVLRKKVSGKKIAIVDDVISAGSATRKTFHDLQACSATPVVIAALLIKGTSIIDFATQHQIAVANIASLPDNLWLPTDCPLCARHITLENVAP